MIFLPLAFGAVAEGRRLLRGRLEHGRLGSRRCLNQDDLRLGLGLRRGVIDRRLGLGRQHIAQKRPHGHLTRSAPEISTTSTPAMRWSHDMIIDVNVDIVPVRGTGLTKTHTCPRGADRSRATSATVVHGCPTRRRSPSANRSAGMKSRTLPLGLGDPRQASHPNKNTEKNCDFFEHNAPFGPFTGPVFLFILTIYFTPKNAFCQ